MQRAPKQTTEKKKKKKATQLNLGKLGMVCDL
jgi:hypothetical protein